MQAVNDEKAGGGCVPSINLWRANEAVYCLNATIDFRSKNILRLKDLENPTVYIRFLSENREVALP